MFNASCIWRYARNGEPLSDLTRGEIIDLIYARYPDSEAKFMRWVRCIMIESARHSRAQRAGTTGLPAAQAHCPR